MLGTIEREFTTTRVASVCSYHGDLSSREKVGIHSPASPPRRNYSSTDWIIRVIFLQSALHSALKSQAAPLFSPASDQRAHRSIRSIPMIILICSLHSGTFSFSVFLCCWFGFFVFLKSHSSPFYHRHTIKGRKLCDVIWVLNEGFSLLFGNGGWGI